MESENQDWVQDILQTSSNATKEKAHVNPNVAFPFQGDFSVGTIHGANAGINESTLQQAASDNNETEGVIEILDIDYDNDVSVLTFKTQDELVALLVLARKQLSGASASSWVASGSDLPPGSSPVAMPSSTTVGGQESTLANSAPSGTDGNGIGYGASQCGPKTS